MKIKHIVLIFIIVCCWENSLFSMWLGYDELTRAVDLEEIEMNEDEDEGLVGLERLFKEPESTTLEATDWDVSEEQYQDIEFEQPSNLIKLLKDLKRSLNALKMALVGKDKYK